MAIKYSPWFHSSPTAASTHFLSQLLKMAAASSIQPPTVHSLNQESAHFPDSDSPESRQDEDAASEGTSLRDLPDLEPEEIEKRLERTRRELSNRRKILIKNLPQDSTNQVSYTILYFDRWRESCFVALLFCGSLEV